MRHSFDETPSAIHPEPVWVRQSGRIEALAGIVLVAFQIFFYLQPLPNSRPLIRRLDVMLVLDPVGQTLPRLGQVENLIERLPLLGIAGGIVGLAWLLGDTICRAILGSSRSRAERVLLGLGVGLGSLPLLVQLAGLAGCLGRPVAIAAALLLLVTWWALGRRRSHEPGPLRPPADVDFPDRGPSWLTKAVLLGAMAPFTILSLLAASLPTTDYDALAYHLLGPKEYWLAGRISFLPHNVYTAFPFLTEMFHLLGMTIMGDDRQGALVGQIVLWCFGPLTAGGVGLVASRWFGATAGWLAALVYLSTPWTYRLSVIPYAEGALLFYTVMTVHAVLRAIDRTPASDAPGWSLVAGLLAGCAGGCKYTGFLVAVLPAGVLVLTSSRPRAMRSLALFLGGVVLLGGPWLVRNAVWTGNPIYPLAYGLLDGAGWSQEKAERFDRAHRPPGFRVGYAWASPDADRREFVEPFLFDMLMRSDWQSGLVFGFAGMALLGSQGRRAAAWWLLVLYEFAVFWGLTHRLDRFWLPLEPVAAVLAGAGIVWSPAWSWKITAGGVLTFGLGFNLAFCTTALCGPNDYTAPLAQERARAIETSAPAVGLLNQLPAQATVLSIGFAGLFESRPRTLYNTVFDDNRFEQLARQPDTSSLRPPPGVHESLARHGIDYIVIDWSWVDRYRSPGNYGYPEFIQPKVFQQLIEAGVLVPVPVSRNVLRERIVLFQVRPAGSKQ